ncbi:MAG: class I SAM-dependent methyltransferase [Deltaproteobacteria bacterium]|nr:class I SAM-dependent methyltransferase [Deltaproteobacteria bacterium]MBN2845024.1 class I SAM-dependent methyltransferase [Deltaproteobacteria bacterium]
MTLKSEKTVSSYESWLQSPLGYYVDRRKKEFICNLLNPREGERLLDLACGTGHNLLFFRRKGCDVTGIDTSADRIETARERLGQRAELLSGDCEDLPFSDNEFDIVTMICPNNLNDQRTALTEAVRVCRERIFLGSWNKYSPAALSGKIKDKHRLSFIKYSKLSTIIELKELVKSVLPDVTPTWGSVVFFPLNWYTFAIDIEEKIPVMKNPFGFFIGLMVPVFSSLQTIQDPLTEKGELKVATNGYGAPGAAREIKK